MADMFANVLEQAKKLKEDYEKQQQEFKTQEFSGSSGGGLINVTLTGDGKTKDLTIDPSLVKDNDLNMLQDLIIAALNSAHDKLDEASGATKNNMASDFGANLNIPGLDKIF